MAKTVSDMIRSYERGRYAFSDFLGLTDIDEVLTELRTCGNIPYELWGGAEDAERVILRIGSEETLGYYEEYPISVVEISPKNQKFADELTHRDFLGALINLGIERSTLGDIYIDENVGYVLCLSKIAQFIVENLTRVKHTSVLCKAIEALPKLSSTEPGEAFVRSSSLRLDSIIAKTYNLSRTASQELFTAGKVFVGGRLCESPSYTLKEGDTISVRGYGRIKLVEVGTPNKKGKLGVSLLVFG